MPDDRSRPTWKGTSLDQPITKVAIPLIAIRDSVGHPSGTACIIAPYLAITARHVVEDHFELFEGTTPAGECASTYQVLTYVVPSPGTALPFFVARTWASALTDIAV